MKSKTAKYALRAIGIALILGGIVLTIIGFSSFSSFGFEDEGPDLFFCTFIGMPCIPVGIFLTVITFQDRMHERAIERSAKMIATLAPTNPAIKAPKICPCGQICPPEATFCTKCGSPLVIKCECGTDNKPDYDFCMGCGKPLKKNNEE